MPVIALAAVVVLYQNAAGSDRFAWLSLLAVMVLIFFGLCAAAALFINRRDCQLAAPAAARLAPQPPASTGSRGGEPDPPASPDAPADLTDPKIPSAKNRCLRKVAKLAPRKEPVPPTAARAAAALVVVAATAAAAWLLTRRRSRRG